MTDYLRICGPCHHMSGYAHMTRAAISVALAAGYTVQAEESDKRLEYTISEITDTDGAKYQRCERAIVEAKVRIPIPEPQWDELTAALKTEIPDDAPTLLVQLPPMLSSWPQHVKGPRIAWTMGESDRLHWRWAQSCKGVDTILVPSRYCHAAFSKSLPGADVRVMPIPVDERVWTPDGPRWEWQKQTPPPFLFLSVFATSERKQWRLLMQAFAEEFEACPEVGLVVKPGRWVEVEEMAQWCRDANAWVHCVREVCTDHDIAALYRSADVYVGPTAEGFGLCFIEAAMCGIPSIALDDGGAAEFVNADNGYVCRSHRKPLIGHLPQVYTSQHNFPQCTIHEFRRVLRAAYEDAQRSERAKRATERAAAYTPSALAPRFREMIERASIKRRGFEASIFFRDPPEKKLVQCMAVGAWGDAFTSIGRAGSYRANHPGVHVGFVHYGSDKAIAEFAALQGVFDEVCHIQPKSKDDYKRLALRAILWRDQFRNDWLPEMLEGTGIDPSSVIGTHVNQVEDVPLIHWHDAALPQEIRAWAHTQHRVWGDFILLHPISTQSAPLHEHWPGWEMAIRWLVEETPYTYVLTGMECVPYPTHERLIDLVGKTPSMMHVLALAEKANGVISTCNAMSLWTVIQRIPNLVCSNTVFDEEHNYFHRWVNTEPNELLYHWATVGWFQLVAKRWLTERFALENQQIEKPLRYEDVAPAMASPTVAEQIRDAIISKGKTR